MTSIRELNFLALFSTIFFKDLRNNYVYTYLNDKSFLYYYSIFYELNFQKIKFVRDSIKGLQAWEQKSETTIILSYQRTNTLDASSACSPKSQRNSTSLREYKRRSKRLFPGGHIRR